MAEPLENYLVEMEAITRHQHVKKKFLSQFWIWQPYSKHSLSETELRKQGYKNLGDFCPQEKNFQNE